MSGNKTTSIIWSLRKAALMAGGLLLCAGMSVSPAMAAVCLLSDAQVRIHQEFVSVLQSARILRTYSTQQYTPKDTQNCTLMVSVGAVAAKRLVEWPGPVLHTLITSEQYQSLYSGGSSLPRSAVFMDQPLQRYLALIRASMPERQHVMLLGSRMGSEELQSLGETGKPYGLELEGIAFQQNMLVDHVLRKHARKDSVLLILPDANVLNSGTVRPLIMASYQRDIPFVTYSESLVKAGAMMSVHVDAAAQAQESLSRINDWLASRRWKEADYAEQYDIAINYQLARAMRQNLPAKSSVLEMMREVP